MAAAFEVTFDSGKKCWHYQYRIEESDNKAKTISQGNLAMVLLSTGRMLGVCALPEGGRNDMKLPDLLENWMSGAETLCTEQKKYRTVQMLTLIHLKTIIVAPTHLQKLKIAASLCSQPLLAIIIL